MFFLSYECYGVNIQHYKKVLGTLEVYILIHNTILMSDWSQMY